MFLKINTFMHLTRNYLKEDYSSDAILVLEAASTHHLVKVLRKKEGHEIEIFDGKGHSCVAKIVSINSRKTTVQIIGKKSFSPKEGISIFLGQALIKPDALGFSIQKATELGVDSISPLLTERSVTKIKKESFRKKKEKWLSISQGACEQCGQNWLPEINNPSLLRDWSSSIEAEKKIVLYPGASKKISEIRFTNSVALAIGPEGDFTSEEIEDLVKEGFTPVSMGTRILRAETAAISALSTIRTLAGDF